MTRNDIMAEFDVFFEFSGEDRGIVTSVSCRLFAEHIANIAAAAEREACCSPDVTNVAGISASDAPHVVVEKYRAAIRAISGAIGGA